MDAPTILGERRERVLWITLNRPEAMNSLTPSMVAGIDALLSETERSRDVAAVVITGAGKAFCAGADLKGARAGFDGDDAGAAADRFTQSVLALTCRLEALPVPVIAAVNGVALAGGLELVLACDLVIASRLARFGDAHANYGLLPGAGSSVRLPARIGINRSKYLMFTGELFSAEQLERWGLVVDVMPPEDLIASAAALAGRLATKSPLGLARMKRLINDSGEQPLGIALRNEQLMSHLHTTSHDRAEGLAAFGEKRSPRFIGR